MLGKSLGFLGSMSMGAFICTAVYTAEEVLVMCLSWIAIVRHNQLQLFCDLLINFWMLPDATLCEGISKYK